MRGQFNNLKIEFLKVYNKTLCARRKSLHLKYEQGACMLGDEICDKLFELTCVIDANGREILRLRGNKWSVL